MSMKYKTQCICQHPDWNSKLTSQPVSLRWMCECHGSKEEERELRLDEYDGDFVPVVQWAEKEGESTDIEDYYDDIYVRFVCSCGDEISLNEFGDDTVCSCGRVYRLTGEIQKNDTHKSDTEYWDKVKKEKYIRFKND